MDIKTEARIQLREHFFLDEFINSMDENKLKGPDPALLDGLQFIRYIVGEIEITSAYRSPMFNRSIGGSYNSFHLEGKAADIKFDFTYWHKLTLVKLFRAAGFTNVKFYYKEQRLHRCHVDT